jgi:hypothetical protein
MKAAFYYYFWISFYLYINKVGKLTHVTPYGI